MDKTEDVPVSELLRRSSRKTDLLAYSVECRQHSGQACRYSKKDISTFAPTQLGDTPARTWNRFENDSGSPRSCGFGSDDDLPPSLPTSLAGCIQPHRSSSHFRTG